MPAELDNLVKKLKNDQGIDNPYALANWILAKKKTSEEELKTMTQDELKTYIDEFMKSHRQIGDDRNMGIKSEQKESMVINEKFWQPVESFKLREDLDPITKRVRGVIIEGIAIKANKPTRNNVSYSYESLVATVGTLVGKPFLDSHDDKSIRQSPPLGHVIKAEMIGDEMHYAVDVDPAESVFIRKAKRGDIPGTSIQVLVSEAVQDMNGVVQATVREFLELSAVLIPGSQDTTMALRERFGGNTMVNVKKEAMLDCELCGKKFNGNDAHPKGTNACPQCMKGQRDGLFGKESFEEYVKCPKCSHEMMLKKEAMSPEEMYQDYVKRGYSSDEAKKQVQLRHPEYKEVNAVPAGQAADEAPTTITDKKLPESYSQYHIFGKCEGCGLSREIEKFPTTTFKEGMHTKDKLHCPACKGDNLKIIKKEIK